MTKKHPNIETKTNEKKIGNTSANNNINEKHKNYKYKYNCKYKYLELIDHPPDLIVSSSQVFALCGT